MIRVDVTEHNTRPAKRGRTSATISKPALYSRVAGSTLVVTSCFANTLFITLLTPSTPCTRVRSAFQSARIKALNTVRRAQTGAAGWPLSTSSPRPHVFPRLYLAWPSSLTNNFSFRHPSSSPFFYQNPKLSAEFRIWQESGRMLREGWLKATTQQRPPFLPYHVSVRVSGVSWLKAARVCEVSLRREREKRSFDRVIFPWWMEIGRE